MPEGEDPLALAEMVVSPEPVTPAPAAAPAPGTDASPLAPPHRLAPISPEPAPPATSGGSEGGALTELAAVASPSEARVAPDDGLPPPPPPVETSVPAAAARKYQVSPEEAAQAAPAQAASGGGFLTRMYRRLSSGAVVPEPPPASAAHALEKQGSDKSLKRPSFSSGSVGSALTGSTSAKKTLSSRRSLVGSEDQDDQVPTNIQAIMEARQSALGNTSVSSLPEDVKDADHIRLLYMIDVYCSVSAPKDNHDDDEGGGDDGGGWVRRLPLLILIYEGIIQRVFDYDYAPTSDFIFGKRIYLNISQEGRDDLDDLQENGLVHTLKMSSNDYRSSLAYRPTARGHALIAQMLTDEDRDAVEKFVYTPNGKPDLLVPQWHAENGEFTLRGLTSNITRLSTITDIEDVSYVSSPYIPESLRRDGSMAMTDNAGRLSELKEAAMNIRDELDEAMHVGHCHVLIGEFIPFGANQIFALNDKLGSSERVQGGLFTAVVDDCSSEAQLQGLGLDLTSVNILDFDLSKYVNFESEVFFEEDEGIVQVEHFGAHVREDGSIVYGVKVEGIMQQPVERISLDNLSRVLCDLQQDSNKISDNLLSPHQSLIVDLVFNGEGQKRDKFNIIFAESMEPLREAEAYLDKETLENELKQVLGDTHSAHDLGDGQVLIVGRNGVLLGGKGSRRHEELMLYYLACMSRSLFIFNVFNRCFVVSDTLDAIREEISEYEKNPNSIPKIREMLSSTSKDCIVLAEIQTYLEESMDLVVAPELPTDDPAAAELFRVLDLTTLRDNVMRRARDMRKNIDGARHDVNALREMTDVISEATQFRMQEALSANTKNLEDVFRANERASASLAIMQVVLAGSLAFDIIDRCTAMYLAVGNEIEWAYDYIMPVLDIPFAWLLINLASWAIIGGLILLLMRFLAQANFGMLSVRVKINTQVNMEALRRYLSKKLVEVEDLDGDGKTDIVKITYVETDGSKWGGCPPKVELLFDEGYGFLLKAFLQFPKTKGRLSQAELRGRFYAQLLEAGVLGLEQLKQLGGMVAEEGHLPKSASARLRQNRISVARSGEYGGAGSGSPRKPGTPGTPSRSPSRRSPSRSPSRAMDLVGGPTKSEVIAAAAKPFKPKTVGGR